MGLFNAYKSLSKANDTLKRLEYTFRRLQTNNTGAIKIALV